MLAQAPIMVAVIQGPNHILTQANDTYLQALGASRSAVGKPIGSVFADLRIQHSDRLLDKVYATGQELIDYERHWRIRRGTPRRLQDVYFNFALQPVKNKSGDVVAVCVYGMEVTKKVVRLRKTRADKQRELNTQAMQLRQQNLELQELNTSKDEFIALASHQLRTPATGVKQYLGMVLEGYVGDLPPMQRDFLRQAYASNERQLSTINDLLQIAQIDANKITLNTEQCNVIDIVNAVADEQKNNIERRRQRLRIIKNVVPAIVWADQLRLRMVLDNLVDNASKYSPEGTAITVTISGAPRKIIVAVADQGVGIAQADFAKLFQKFSRIDNPLSIVVGGNGLGLYLAKKHIDAHGGSIDVQSVPGQGTTFTLQLPTPAEL